VPFQKLLKPDCHTHLAFAYCYRQKAGHIEKDQTGYPDTARARCYLVCLADARLTRDSLFLIGISFRGIGGASERTLNGRFGAAPPHRKFLFQNIFLVPYAACHVLMLQCDLLFVQKMYVAAGIAEQCVDCDSPL
jgi:hypothetical protein